ncbi:MAG: hypothetical protein AAFR79_13355 [Pseudomonadota bacterium]
MAMGLLIAVWALASVGVGWVGHRRGQDFWFGFRWSVILSPPLGAALVLLSRRRGTLG